MIETNAPGSTSALAGTRALVLGAAGEVGEGIVRELLRHGAEVVAVSRQAERLASLHDRLRQAALEQSWARRFVPLEGGVHSEAAASALVSFLAVPSRRPSAVVASLGGWRQGPFVADTSMPVWSEAIEQSLAAHVLAARSLLPMLVDIGGGSYTLINGGAALRPVPGAGAMCVSAAGQLMLMRVLHAEYGQSPIRINTLLLDTPVRTRSRPSGPATWISADDAGAGAGYLMSPECTLNGDVLILDHPNVRQKLGAPFA